MKNSTILTCGCGDTDQFAEDAFKILFPAQKIPNIVHSMGIINNKLLRTVVNGLVGSNDKYAYFLKWSEQSIEVWDLLKGVRIQ